MGRFRKALSSVAKVSPSMLTIQKGIDSLKNVQTSPRSVLDQVTNWNTPIGKMFYMSGGAGLANGWLYNYSRQHGYTNSEAALNGLTLGGSMYWTQRRVKERAASDAAQQELQRQGSLNNIQDTLHPDFVQQHPDAPVIDESTPAGFSSLRIGSPSAGGGPYTSHFKGFTGLQIPLDAR